jgi:hypothetical protein
LPLIASDCLPHQESAQLRVRLQQMIAADCLPHQESAQLRVRLQQMIAAARVAPLAPLPHMAAVGEYQRGVGRWNHTTRERLS